MEISHQELTKLQMQDRPKLPDGRVLGLAQNKKHKRSEPSITYQLADNADLAKIDKAFDVLFEETLRQMGNLTS